jgi:hypothetical protein
LNAKTSAFVIISCLLIITGIGCYLASLVPVAVHNQVPYTGYKTQTINNVLADGSVSSLMTYFNDYASLNQGDIINIQSSTTDPDVTLTASVGEFLASDIQKQENVTSINLSVTVPKSGYYEISVSRYRHSVFVIFLERTNATVKVTTQTTEQVPVTLYHDVAVTTYPYKDYQTYGIPLLLAGIGVAVLAVAQNITSKQLVPPPPPSP